MTASRDMIFEFKTANIVEEIRRFTCLAGGVCVGGGGGEGGGEKKVPALNLNVNNFFNIKAKATFLRTALPRLRGPR